MQIFCYFWRAWTWCMTARSVKELLWIYPSIITFSCTVHVLKAKGQIEFEMFAFECVLLRVWSDDAGKPRGCVHVNMLRSDKNTIKAFERPHNILRREREKFALCQWSAGNSSRRCRRMTSWADAGERLDKAEPYTLKYSAWCAFVCRCNLPLDSRSCSFIFPEMCVRKWDLK